jgi:cytochrome P450 / NADPH-cytochrome P450 reductase
MLSLSFLSFPPPTLISASRFTSSLPCVNRATCSEFRKENTATMPSIDIRDTTPIPQPAGWPIVGNLTDVDPELPILSLQQLGEKYGEIFSLTTFGQKRVFVTSQRLLEELCDEKRFGKLVAGPLKELRNGIHDGLFTAQNDEANWGSAHRVLVPAFGPLNISAMFDDMKDIASQLILKWARFPDYKIPTTDDFTRLTLDTLALCAMDYRFNSVRFLRPSTTEGH